jgi:hypothetical protein
MATTMHKQGYHLQEVEIFKSLVNYAFRETLKHMNWLFLLNHFPLVLSSTLVKASVITSVAQSLTSSYRPGIQR